MDSTGRKQVARAREAWHRGDAAFILNIQGETVWFKNQTNESNALLINEISKIGWSLQGTAEKMAGRRVFTFGRVAESIRSDVGAGTLAEKIARLPLSKRQSIERLVDNMLRPNK